MSHTLPASESERVDFLRQHGLTPEEFSQSEITWDLLDDICAHHHSRFCDLESIADYLSSRLRTISEVHSLKARIKDPGHLAAKLIRKKIENQDIVYDVENYDQQITDLIGI